MLSCFLLGSVFACTLAMVVYRLHLHPLSKFPGPRLAAITGLYEIYFLAQGDGTFEKKILRMHRRYGPVVRITPDEVHVQEQFCIANYNLADGWIKGNRALNSCNPQRIRTYPVGKRSISRVRSLLQGGVTNLFLDLAEKLQALLRPRSSSRAIISMSFYRSEAKVPPTASEPIGSDVGSDDPRSRSIRSEHRSKHRHTLYSTVQRMSRRGLPFST